MGKRLYALKEPRDDKAWNIYALREASKLKKWLLGVYYHPDLKRLLVVFNPTPGTHINKLVFEDISERLIHESYKMECPEGCGRCCVIQSGAFILSSEVDELPEDMKVRLKVQPVETVKTMGGPVKVYKLGTGPMGMCMFFNPSTAKCILEELGGKHLKPIICLITYCTVFASRNGKLYLKTGYKELSDGRIAMYYREATPEEWNRALMKMSSALAKYRKAKMLS